MIPLENLFEYEDTSMKGIPLGSSMGVEYDPTLHNHHRYHRTKAGLYVVLQHRPNGEIWKRDSIGKAGSIYTSAEGDNQYPLLGNDFSFESAVNVLNPNNKEGYRRTIHEPASRMCLSTTKHISGLKITYAVDDKDSQILGVNVRIYKPIKEELFGTHSPWNDPLEVPIWQIEITKKENKVHCQGVITDLHTYELCPQGKVRGRFLDLKGRVIDYAASINQILENMHHNLPNPYEYLIFK